MALFLAGLVWKQTILKIRIMTHEKLPREEGADADTSKSKRFFSAVDGP